MTSSAYAGPLRGQPVSIELHNTVYATAAGPCDGLQDAGGLCAWLEAMGLPAVDPSRRVEFVALRSAVRAALHARLDGVAIPAAARAALNAASAADPRSPALAADGSSSVRHHARDATTAALAAIAADAIELLGGPRCADLRACGAPGCVLVFLRDHPRRAWCSDACGNRARQARHYARQRRG